MKDWADVDHAEYRGVPRIACLVPSITELLFDLGLGQFVVARTGFCIHPAPQVLKVQKVGGTKDVNLKKLRSLAPTHVIVNVDENRQETYQEIRKFAPQVLVTHPCAPDDNLQLFELLGFVFGAQSEAQRLAAQFRVARAQAQTCAALPSERVLYLIWREPWMTVGAETYIAKTLALVGWDCALPKRPPQRPAAQIQRYPTLDEIDPVWAGVDRILLSTEPYAFSETDRAYITEIAPQVSITFVDGEMTSWYGSRAIVGLGYLRNLRNRLVSQSAV